MVFPEKLNRILQLRGLSARALASELNLSNATVSAWLRDRADGGSAPRPDALKALAEFLRVPIEILADDSKPIPVEQHVAELAESAKTAAAEHPDNPAAARATSDYLDLRNANRRQAASMMDVLKEIATIGRELDHEETRFDLILAAIRGEVDTISPEMHEAARRRAAAAGAARQPSHPEVRKAKMA